MIEVKNLTKSYGAIEALRGISFTVSQGEIVGFLGPNGAGKTTTMKILTGFIPQGSGTVTVDGKDIADHSMEVRRKIGYLPESNPLYPDMLVYDYLAYVGSIRQIPKKDLHEKIAKTANLCGLADRVGQPIGTLSKGFRQRVGLAQALIHEPEVLILDEPTSGLDPNQIVEIRNLIKTLGKDRTILLSTHNLPEVMAACNRMLIVHDGVLVADGTPAELQALEEDRQRIRVTLRGAPENEIMDVLTSIVGAESIESVITAELDAHAFELVGAKEPDLRPAIFKTVVERAWELVELHRQVLDLEGIFSKLTKEI